MRSAIKGQTVVINQIDFNTCEGGLMSKEAYNQKGGPMTGGEGGGGWGVGAYNFGSLKAAV